MFENRIIANKLPPMDDGSPSARDLQIYELVCQGYSKRKVAEKFDITPGRICQICDAVDQHQFPILQKQVRLLKSRQTASLTHIFNEAMAAWVRSMEAEVSVTVTEKTTTSGQFPGDTKTSSRSTKQPVGGAAFLSTAMAALDDIRKIWGVDKLEALEPEKPNEEEFRFSGMPRDVAIRLYVEHKRKKLQQILDNLTRSEGTGDTTP